MPFSIIQAWKRKRILKQPFPQTWEPHLKGMPFFAELDSGEQDKLRRLVQVFVAEKNWEGCGGMQLDNSVRVGIAAQACLLILHLDHAWYRRVRSILVYPSSFRSSFASVGADGVVRQADQAHAGEAWLGGEVILAWDQAFAGGRDATDGRNPVFHEFAHKLDMLDGYADGAPPFRDAERARAWNSLATEHFAELKSDIAAGRKTLIDPYGATNPAEFFAVATETFFERGVQLRKQHAELYRQLRMIYRQDPALRRTPARV